MGVESLLRSADLPEVSVDADDALQTTVQRGMRRRRRRRGIGALAALTLVVLLGLIAVTAVVPNGDKDLSLATGPSDGSSTVSSEPEPGDPATWDVDRSNPPSSASSTFTALVTRIGCSGGVTGTVLRPGVVMTDTEVEITFTVDSLGAGDQTCPGNDAVPYVVDLGQAIGNRNLVDRACVEGADGAMTTFCTSSAGVRWRADGAPVLSGNFSATGQMVLVGGPMGEESLPARGTVSALDAAGAVVASAETDEFGGFRLAVPNGTYRVVGRSPSYQDGAVDCTAEREIVVHDRGVEGVRVLCPRD